MSYKPIEIGESADLGKIIESYGFYEGSFKGRKIVIVKDSLNPRMHIYHLAQKTNVFYFACLYITSFFTKINLSSYTTRPMNQELGQDICSHIDAEFKGESKGYFYKTFRQEKVFTTEDPESEIHKNEITYIDKGLKKLQKELKSLPALKEQWQKVDELVSELIFFSNNDGYHPDYGFNSLGNYKSGLNKSHYFHAGYTLDDLKFTSAEMKYNRAGYDRDGYDREGYDLAGFERNNGPNKSGNTLEEYKYYHYSWSNWAYELHKDSNGILRNGLDLDREGYKEDGYDICGFDRRGFNKSGCTMKDYLDAGLTRFDCFVHYSKGRGYDAKGYDLYGFNVLGINESGYSRDAYLQAGITEKALKTLKIDQQGVLRNAAGYDRRGYRADGTDLGGKKYKPPEAPKPPPAAAQPKQAKQKLPDDLYRSFAMLFNVTGIYPPKEDINDNPYLKGTKIPSFGGAASRAAPSHEANAVQDRSLKLKVQSFISSIQAIVNYQVPQGIRYPDLLTKIKTSAHVQQLIKLLQKNESLQEMYSLSLTIAKELLNISESSSDADKKKAYRKVALATSPDKVPQEQRELATILMQCVNTARALLDIE